MIALPRIGYGVVGGSLLRIGHGVVGGSLSPAWATVARLAPSSLVKAKHLPS
jgi:hypothetical protein